MITDNNWMNSGFCYILGERFTNEEKIHLGEGLLKWRKVGIFFSCRIINSPTITKSKMGYVCFIISVACQFREEMEELDLSICGLITVLKSPAIIILFMSHINEKNL